MSRFQKALDRARSTSAGQGLNLPEEAPSIDMFEAPWGIDERPERPALAAVPARAAVAPRPALAQRFHPDLSDRVVVHSNVPPIVVEQYRMLAASLQRWQADTGGKAVLVAGAAAGDGATLTTVNLAITLTGAYQRRVLLVDCDRRGSGLHMALVVGRGGDPATSYGPPASVAVTPRLSVVHAGATTGDPERTLTANVITLLEREREGFDWVLLDTPAISAGPEARFLSEHVDGAVLVIGAGKSGRRVLADAVSALGRERVLGVVLNGVDPRDMPDGVPF
jgi:Mrp family chromosome partitioning ATPase